MQAFYKFIKWFVVSQLTDTDRNTPFPYRAKVKMEYMSISKYVHWCGVAILFLLVLTCEIMFVELGSRCPVSVYYIYFELM